MTLRVWATVWVLGAAATASAQWTDTVLGEGVIHRRQVYSNLYGGTQTVNVIQVNLDNPNVRVAPIRPASGCARTSVLANNARALGAINGGYFDGTCNSLSMIKINGTVHSTNPGWRPARATLGLKPNAASITPTIARIASTNSWTAVDHALGGGPNLVTNNALDITVSGEGFDAALANRNPRTAVGITATNQLLMVTVDGRTAAGLGMTFNELANYMRNLGCINAMNLDGGGSTTMWTSPGGVRNTPSDGSERSVTSALAVWSDGVIVDNGTAGYAEVGSWGTSTASGFFGTNSRWSQGGTGSNTATWTPNLPVSGRYEVLAWWVAGSNRATNSPFRIDHISGSNTISANQTLNGARWNSLGEFSFNAGNTGRVVLNNGVASDRVVSADALRFVYKGPSAIVQDNVGPNFIASSNWQVSTGAPGFLGDNFHVRATQAVSDAATWRANLPVAGNYRVFARWTAASNRSTTAPYVVVHTGGSTTIQVNQQQNGGQWVLLGTFNMAAGTLDRVRLSCWTTAGFFVSADAVMFELQ
jgi:hypothetical protein